MRSQAVRRAVIARAASIATLCFTHPHLPAQSSAEVEPEAAQKLFELCQGRRPSDSWSAQDRLLVDTLVDELLDLRLPWRREAGRGKWRLAYLQPGIDGMRQPFLGITSNEQYQIVSNTQLVNVAELLGPTLEVRAAGPWREDTTDMRSPKRFRSDLLEGAMCGAFTMGMVEKANVGRACLPLPLRGETYRIFQGEYVDSHIRIGQDVTSGGARVVQVRVGSFSGR